MEEIAIPRILLQVRFEAVLLRQKGVAVGSKLPAFSGSFRIPRRTSEEGKEVNRSGLDYAH
jgi:hypothetical protein